MDLKSYISEAISSRDNSKMVKTRSRYLQKYEEFEQELSRSTFYAWFDGGDWFDGVDRVKPIGLPKHINFSGLWMYTDKSKVTGNKRMFIFNELHTYYVLDFDENEDLVGIKLIWTTNGKPLGYTTEQLLEKLGKDIKK